MLFRSTDGEMLAVVSAVPYPAKGERLVVFHVCDVADPRDLCRRLAHRGLPNLWVPGADAFARIEEIPVLGSGKLDLKHLAQLALETFGPRTASE